MRTTGRSGTRQTLDILVVLWALLGILTSDTWGAGFAGGTGEPNAPFQIAYAEQLTSIGSDPNLLNKHYVLVADIDLDPNLPGNKVFGRSVIAPDTDDKASYFQGDAFTGKFDGQGHAIAGMVIDSNAAYAGLFGLIGTNGQVCNLRLFGGSVRGQARIVGQGRFADIEGGTGGLAAESRGMVTACYCEVTVKGTYTVGGLVGSNSGTISTSYSLGSIGGTDNVGGLVGINEGGSVLTSYSMGSVDGRDSVGGLVGINDDGSVSTSYSMGYVGGRDSVGGLVGSNDCGSISTSYSMGPVRGTGFYVGGLVGANWFATISNCYSTGSVSGTGFSVGGLVGHESSSRTLTSFWDIQTSGLTASNSGMGLTTAQMQMIQTFLGAGWDFADERVNGVCDYWQMPVGGGYPTLGIFNGYIPPVLPGAGTIDDPYLVETPEDLGTIWYRPRDLYRLTTDIDLSGIKWGMALIPAFSGKFDGQGHRIRSMTISGVGHLGFIGFLAEGAVLMDLRLEDVNIVGTGHDVGSLVGYNKGNISASSSTGSVISRDSYVGGLVGRNESGTISTSCSTSSVSGWIGVGGLVGSNSGTISTSYSMGSVKGGFYVGGLVGQTGSGTISTSYSTGSVRGGEDVGGLVGRAYGPVSSSFWDIQTSGKSTSAGGSGLSTAQMQTILPFLGAGWDFVGETKNGTDDLWVMPMNDYPRLAWEPSQ